MSLDIRSDHFEIIRKIIFKNIPQHEVIAFGSRTQGTAHKNSDLDLCIKGKKPLSFTLIGNLRDEFSESNLPYKIDVVDWFSLDEEFKKIVTREGVELQN
jgi:predicted nucleotidyltransferase